MHAPARLRIAVGGGRRILTNAGTGGTPTPTQRLSHLALLCLPVVVQARRARTGMTGKAAPLPTQRDKEDWAHTGAPSKRAMVNRQGRATKKKQAINGELHSNDNHAATGDTQGEREGRPRASGTTPQHAKVWVRGPQEIRAHARPRRRHDRSTDRPAEHRGQETRPHLSTSAL